MSTLSTDAANISFLVSGFSERVPGARDAIIVSSDGLLMAKSDGMTRGSADRFAAAASGLIGLAYGASAPFGGGRVSEIVIEMEAGFIFVTGISDGSLMAVLAEPDADVGLIGYEMARLVEQCGGSLTPQLRAELQGAIER